MPRFALLADIHGNRVALERVLDDLSGVPVDHVVCLGDVVGYGPDPAGCLDLVEEHCDVIVMGNHDEAVLVEEAADRFNDHARSALAYSRDQLTPWHRRLFKLIPYQCELDGVTFAHGSFGKGRFDYLYTSESAQQAFRALETRYGAVGHTHLPSVFTAKRDDAGIPYDVRTFPLHGTLCAKLPTERSIIVNPGAVGQPRDRNPDASWGVLDTDVGSIEIRRVAYDVEAVGVEIKRLGLPSIHGERLRVGA